MSQVADFARHKWNCFPVMVTEIAGKGRGLVAAKDIKLGEVIFTDKPVIKVFTKTEEGINDVTFKEHIEPVLEQLSKVPSEARRQFQELRVPDGVLGQENVFILTYLKFVANCTTSRAMDGSGLYCSILSLNFALVNHSCTPNVDLAMAIPDDEYNVKLEAIKDISRGEEISVSYLNDDFISEFGMNRQKRREKLKKSLYFDCNCSFCSENPD